MPAGNIEGLIRRRRRHARRTVRLGIVAVDHGRIQVFEDGRCRLALLRADPLRSLHDAVTVAQTKQESNRFTAMATIGNFVALEDLMRAATERVDLRGFSCHPASADPTHNSHFLLRRLIPVRLLVQGVLIQESGKNEAHLIRILTSLQGHQPSPTCTSSRLTGKIIAEMPWEKVSKETRMGTQLTAIMAAFWEKVSRARADMQRTHKFSELTPKVRIVYARMFFPELLTLRHDEHRPSERARHLLCESPSWRHRNTLFDSWQIYRNADVARATVYAA